MSDVEVTEHVRADPTAVYAMVSDVTRMGSWSPETTSCRWLDDATCTVTHAEPGRQFAFDVDYAGVPISRWSYDFAATAAGCSVTESWTDRRPTLMRLASVPVMGIADRAKHNRGGMETTLAALRAVAEG